MSTATIPVIAYRRQPVPSDLVDRLLHADLETDLQRARIVADWLDTKFSVAGVRFGFDTILGLVPVVGDTLGALVGLYPLLVARRHKLGRALEARMAANLLVEWGVGAIPFIGDLFDTAFKANIRNVRLLEKAARSATKNGRQDLSSAPR